MTETMSEPMRWDSAGSDPIEDVLYALKPRPYGPPRVSSEFQQAVRDGAVDPFLGELTNLIRVMLFAKFSKEYVESRLQTKAENLYGPGTKTALTEVDGKIVSWSIVRPGIDTL